MHLEPCMLEFPEGLEVVVGHIVLDAQRVPPVHCNPYRLVILYRPPNAPLLFPLCCTVGAALKGAGGSRLLFSGDPFIMAAGPFSADSLLARVLVAAGSFSADSLLSRELHMVSTGSFFTRLGAGFVLALVPAAFGLGLPGFPFWVLLLAPGSLLSRVLVAAGSLLTRVSSSGSSFSS